MTTHDDTTTEEREKKGNRAVNDLPRTMHGRDGEAGAGAFGKVFSYTVLVPSLQMDITNHTMILPILALLTRLVLF